MKGTALLLLCAVTLAQASLPQLTLSGKVCHCNPGEAANVCSQNGSNDQLIVHENCNQFYKCAHGSAIPYFCPANLLYNPLAEQCDWPQNVLCGDRPIVQPDTESEEQDNTSNEGQGNETTCNCNPEDAPALCAVNNSSGILVAHQNCNQFYKCDNGVPVTLSCPSGLLYNPYTEECDWPRNVECGDRPIVEIGDGGSNGGDEDCDVDSGNGNGESEGGNGDSGTCNCNPGEAPGICGAAGSDGVLVAHENCNQFYKCDNGAPVALWCPAGLVYNPYDERCDWPANVDCGDKPIVECEEGNGDNGSGGNGDNGGGDNSGTCNCNPGEAPGICGAANSDGVLVAHENCNQFYKCDNGAPVALWCPAGLVYNPYDERCDWPANVDCGDKPIVKCEEGNGDNGSGGNGDNGGGDNSGTCNCNPGEAPGICGAAGSDGVLVAHENCNQFYKCDHGAPVALWCPAGLVYNPYDERCDWPFNVDCGDRPVVEVEGGGSSESGNNGGGNSNEDNTGTCNCNPDEAPGICGTPGSDGVLVAHENCNQFYKCDHGAPVALWCPSGLVYNPFDERCDWPANVDCGNKPIVECEEGNGDNGSGGNGDNGSGGNGDNGGGDNSGTCNCNPGEAPGICGAAGSDGVLIAHENCNQFYKCDHGAPVALWCPAGLVYNPYDERCDWPANVDCGDKPIVENEAGNGDNGSGGNGDNGSGDNSGTCNCNPGEAPGICSTAGSDGVLVAHENCNQFYKCDHGAPVALWCPAGLVYNPYDERCDWPANVDCGDKPIVECEEGNGDNGSGGNGDNGSGGNGDNGGGDNSGTCNCNPGEAPGICGAAGSDGVLVAHENCNQFYKCDHGAPVALWCPAGLVYNPYDERCDWPFNVDCGDRPVVEVEGGGSSEGGNNGGGNSNEDNTGTCNCNPDEAPGICGTPGSDGVLVAHENCNQFYKCDHGAPVALWCPSGLVYNPFDERCDWPANVDCGDKPIVECEEGNGDNGSGGNGDNGGGDNSGTCNCNPGEAPGICGAAGSDGVLIAHENCNQFYKCDHGAPVALWCPAGLVYNPYDERCDWPANVDCGDKPIVENEAGNGDNGSGGNGDNGSGDNSGTCNCNPGEAPGICGAAGSDGVLVAHENCNQFYKCDHGAPVALWCPAGLVYNPYDERCDWPANVDCGDKPIVENEAGNGDNGSGGNGDNGSGDNSGTCNCNPAEAPGICSTAGSDGVLVAHENCNQFYKCDHGAPVALWCPAGLVYNPYDERCDWPANVDCGDKPIVENEAGNGDNGSGGNGDNGSGDNSGTCNCNPGEAPGICSTAGSDGVLVAHENCNQFYKCDHGAPVALWCPAGLVYNPYNERCDWPANVDCGDKPIVECEEGNGDNGSGGNGDNGSGGNGDNGGGDNSGTCNCNPGEAPGICGAAGSDGVLVAHENCNQFYKCDHGAPVALWCPAGLVYNPYDERCDWPFNVDCGDRPVVEVEGGGSSEGGNNGEGNSNEDNTGTCNCNPDEAPGICGTPGSDGVLVAHENCNQFYKCNHGAPVALWCPVGLVYNPFDERCDWPANVDCGDKPIVEREEGSGDNGSGGNGDNGSGGNGDNGGGDNSGTCNCNPGEAPGICGTAGSDGVLIAHENCNQFYKCDHGAPVALWCPAGLVYNPYDERCDWPANVDCGDKPIVENEAGNGDNGSGGNGDNGSGDNSGTCNCNPGEAPGICSTAGSDGVLVAHENCNQFYKCDHGAPVALWCPAGLVYNPYDERCDWPANVDCGDKPIVENEAGNGDIGSGGNGDTGSTEIDCDDNSSTTIPELAPEICSSEESDGTLIAHENCNQFYLCSHGTSMLLTCQPGLVYNPDKSFCDWPINVADSKCGERPVDEIESGGNGQGGDNESGGSEGGGNSNEDNSSTCNCNPGEAPAICGSAGSDDKLIAHENCNQFYKCAHGIPVALWCPAGLVYNPYIERCDWPSLVDCGDRPIVENEAGNGDSGNGDSGSGGNGDNGSGSNNGTCNCNPGEAPAICGAADSDGVLIAHENCTQFYKCAHGVPVALWCPDGLLYNPKIERCDWPSLVDCGDRPIVENEAGNGDSGNGDSGSGGNGENGSGSNNGTCNCNPGEAPAICGATDSDGVLIAHENCTQFYKCAHGVPVALWCPDGLLYNPNIERCDWPSLVDCGDRPIVENEAGNGDSGNGDSGSGGNGDNGSGSNNGTCNCNPGEAPAICGAADSDGILIAHENCTQFYKCAHGVPVALWCPDGLLYNPNIERCDWPSLVDCGDRPIVENEAGNGDSGNGDSGSGGNGDNGSGSNNGTCNCNPGEAPAICGAADSDGVLIAHENCTQFYKCAHGVPVALWCPDGLLYNPKIERCDWPSLVDCGDRPIVENEAGNGDSGNGDSGSGGNGDNGSGSNNGTCNCNPGEAPAICGAADSDGVLIAHENCTQFYKCANGVPVALWCPDGLLYNPKIERCDWPSLVDCGDRPIVENEAGNGDSGNGDSGSGGNGENGNGSNNGTCKCNPGEAPAICGATDSDGILIAHENCKQFYKCAHGVPVALWCPDDLLYNPYIERCDWPSLVDCGDRPIVVVEGGNGGDSNENNNGDNCDPSQAPTICSASGSDGLLVAHENCNMSYICVEGLPVALECPANLLFNTERQACDFAWNVDCGDRISPDNNVGGGGNCDPSEAPAICASTNSNGVLVAHENCDQFYVCTSGKPVALDCPANLLYNPDSEECDWPRNVDCGNRIVPEPESGGNDGPCSCDAREAPSICAKAKATGKLIAHENCNQYYTCFDGKPVARSCPRGLLYDPHTEQCLWPQSVDCEGRAISTSYASFNKHVQARRGFF